MPVVALWGVLNEALRSDIGVPAEMTVMAGTAHADRPDIAGSPVRSRLRDLMKRLVRRLTRQGSFGPGDAAVSSRLTLLVAAGVLPLLVFNLAMIYVDFRNDRASAIHQTLVLSRAVARSTQGFLNTRTADLVELAESRSLANGDLVTFRAKAERLLQQQFPGNAIVLWRPDGETLLDIGGAAGTPLPDRQPRGRPQFGLNRDRPAVSGVFVPSGHRHSVVAIDVPAHSTAGKSELVLTLYIGLDAFASLIDREKPADGWITAIIDQYGVRVARSPAANLIAQPVKAGAPDPWPAQPEATFEGISPDGTQVFAAYCSLPHLGWRASVAVPTDLLTGPAWRSAVLSVAAAFVLLVSGTLLQRKISQGITVPLATLHRIAVAPDSDRSYSDTVATGLREADAVAKALIAEKHSRHDAIARLERALEQRTIALGQRDLLLREVYHRVKNNLQLVDGFLALHIGQATNHEEVEALSDLRSRVYALGLVHQQLMTSADLKCFDIAPFLHQLADCIMAAGGRDNCTMQVAAVGMMVTLDFATPLGLLVNELITNCFKHAHPYGHVAISVNLQRNALGDVVLTVSSAWRNEPNVPSRSGGSREVSYLRGHGIEIITSLAAQIDGGMTIRDGNPYTTEVVIPAASIEGG